MSFKNPFLFSQAFSILSDAKDEDERKRRGLLKLYIEAESYLDKLDKKILALLEQNMGNVREKMNNHEVELKQKEYYLLVAGKMLKEKHYTYKIRWKHFQIRFKVMWYHGGEAQIKQIQLIFSQYNLIHL